MQLGVVTGAILEFHAARWNGGDAPGSNSPLTTALTDTSTGGHNGTLLGATGESPYGGSGTADAPYYAALDGDDYLSCGDLSCCEDKNFAYEIWASTSNKPAANQILLSEGSSTITTRYWWMGLNPSGYLTTYAQDDSATIVANRTGAAVDRRDGAIHQYGLDCNGTVAQLYHNGLPDGVTYTLAGGAMSLNVSAIGCLLRNAAGQFVTGRVYCARVYPGTIGATGFAQNFTAGKAWRVPVLRGGKFW